MSARTLRRIGTAGIVFGAFGLVATLVVLGLALAGATGLPGTLSMSIVALQSVLDIAVGWSLRRRARLAAEPS